jgi:hypothetical protein
MFVYVIVCSETLKVYVGQHKGNNLRQYLQQKMSEARRGFSGRSRLYASMLKHPRESWSIHQLISDLQTRAECDAWERYYISHLKTQHPDVGYNICDGGEGFTGPHTPEALQKMDAKRKKYWSHPENHIKRQEASKKMWANLGTKKKISAAIKNAPCETRFQTGCDVWNTGTMGVMKPNQTSFKPGIVPWNTGTKGATKANSCSFQKGHTLGLGRKFSEKHRRNLSLSHMGHPNVDKGTKRSEATKQKMRDAWVRRKAQI